MPISLGMVESKLKDGGFKNLSELESYLKRMIQNAKEFFPRSSSTFDDAERVRKAVSNYMTKTNPAYQKRGYQAVPTPLPPEDGEADEDAEDGQEETKVEDPGEDEDANEGDEEKEAPEADEEETANDDVGTGRSSRKRSIILKRRGSARHKPPPASLPRRASARFDHGQIHEKESEQEEEEEEEEDVEEGDRAEEEQEEEEAATKGTSYEGLTFQQAQEKFVEDLLQHTEPEYAGPRLQSQAYN